MERLFVLKTRSRTQRATKVKKFVGFSLKPLRCRDPALPPLYGHAYSRPFFHAYFSCTRMRNSAHAYFSCIYAHDTPPRVQHFSAFHSIQDSVGACEMVYSMYLCMRIKMQQIEPDDVMVSHVHVM